MLPQLHKTQLLYSGHLTSRGGAISDELKGTADETFYDHYSQIASAEVNWDLYNLGRNDVTANIWKSLAYAENITNKELDIRYTRLTLGTCLTMKLHYQLLTFLLPTLQVRVFFPKLSSSFWADEYNKQISESYFTSTTTLNTDVPTFTNGASLFESNASTKLGSASTASSSKPVASAFASASASESASSAKPSSANAAAGIAPATGIASLAAMAMALLL